MAGRSSRRVSASGLPVSAGVVQRQVSNAAAAPAKASSSSAGDVTGARPMTSAVHGSMIAELSPVRGRRGRAGDEVG
jgi:hypothetical protein